MAEPILNLVSVSKRFGGRLALDGVSLALRAGEVLGLVGDTGAGKSTLIRAIAGVFPPDGGEIRYRGAACRFASPDAARAAGIETIHQELALAENLDVGANIFLGREPKRRVLGFKILDRRAMDRAAREAAAALDIAIEHFDAPVRELSGGQRQAVAIGRALFRDARVVLMDEPVASLAPRPRAKALDLVRDFKARGAAILFVAHDLDDVFAVADRVAVLRRGALLGQWPKDGTDPEAIARLIEGG